MDTRRRQPAPPDPGLHAGQTAEIDELSTVSLDGPRPPRQPGFAIVAAFVAVALVAFVLGAKSVPGLPAATDAVGGVRNPVGTGAAAAAAGETSGTVTPRPPAVVPSPRLPTLPPPGSWARADLLRDEHLTADAVWGVGNRIVVAARHLQSNEAFQTLAAVVLEPGRAWRSIPVPAPIGMLTGGTVVDDRLWFVARVEGIAPEDTTWRLVSTPDGETWASLGPAIGLGTLDHIQVMGRVRSSWVVAASEFVAGGEALRLLRSPDGVFWSAVELPDVGGVLSYDRISTLGDRLLLLVTAGSPDAPTHEILSTGDGLTWRKEVFPATLHAPYELACNLEACVLTGIEFSVARMPVAWVSVDGREWRESDTLFPPDSQSHGGIIRLAATAEGFLGIEEDPRVVWVSSPDGMSWRALDVIPADNRDDLTGIAVAGDTIVALAYGDGVDVAPGVWRGSFSLLNR